jgi:putative peptidoglycan lipid II flippase
MHVASDQGMLLLGLAEASRSLVLLIGVVLALEERRKILGLALLGLLPALLMAALGIAIQGAIADLLSRLFIGGLACLFCIAVAVVMLVPAALPLALNRFRRTFHVKGELG